MSSSESHAARGDAYRLDREYELSVESYRQALTIDPHAISSAHGLARSLIQLGQLNEAAGILNELVAGGCREADVLFTLCRLPLSLIAVDLLGAVSQGIVFRKPDDGERSAFLRAAGLHLRGQYEECWSCLVDANRRVFAKTQHAYRAGAAARAQVLRRLSAASSNETREQTMARAVIPLFILGPPRAGKSTVEALLGRSAEVRRGFESAIVTNAIERTCQSADLPTGTRLDELPIALDDRFTSFLRDEITRRAAEAKVFTVTSYGVLRSAARLARVLPEARFVFVRRNRADHVFSIFRQHYGLAMDYAYDLGAIREFVGWYEAMGEALAHRFPGTVRALDYETVVLDPASALAMVGELCGFDFAAPSTAVLANDVGCAQPYRGWLT